MMDGSQDMPNEPTLERQRLRVWLRILKLQRLVGAELRERLRVEYDTTLPQFDVMSALDRTVDGLTMSALSEALMVSNGNVTGIVERLVEQGLVERAPVAGDRRATLVRLTGRGRETFSEMAARHRDWVSAALGGLDAGEAAGMIALLDRARPAEVAR
jgi:DNA-binding MarR family transcriptional regulator